MHCGDMIEWIKQLDKLEFDKEIQCKNFYTEQALRRYT